MDVPKDWELPEYEEYCFKPKSSDYCITIPVLNEMGKIDVQLRKMEELCPGWDIIICDGGSTDGCEDPDFMKGLNVRTLLIKTGPGRMSAQQRIMFAYGLSEGYAGIINVDGNNKDGVEAIPEYIRLLKSGYGSVYGSRYLPGGTHKNTPIERELAIRFFHAPLISLGARFRYTDTTNSFRGYSREFMQDPKVKPFRDVFDNYNLPYYLAVRAPRLGYKVIEIPVSRVYPDHGDTPTKITGLRSKLKIIKELLMATFGMYNP